ncbi:MAG: branched-chain amino acid ABC transporter permease [Chloroflexota bacterium]|nr:branched-chain amino acid ABC transporter permease [Chloroflexota bacterium]
MQVDKTASAAGSSNRTAWLDWILKHTLRSPLRLAGILLLVYLIALALARIIGGDYRPDQFARQLIFGLAQGSIYALIALGYTLVYGILLMINFAHGEVFMAGAYIGFFVISALDKIGLLANQTLIALLITMFSGVVASVIVALLLERIAYRPLRNAPRLVPLITAIGASILLQQLFLRLFGVSTRRYPDVNLYAFPQLFPTLECADVNGEQICRGIDLIGGRYDVVVFGLELRILPIHFLVFFLALSLMAALWFIVQRTRVGKAMRAVAEDKSTAALMGVDVDRVIVITFVLGAALAGAGGVLFALYNQQVSPFIGFIPGIKAFTAAVLGGIGNIPGAMFGGLFLGVVESVAPSLLGLSQQLKDVIAFGMLVLVLIFRPTGILGEVLAQKKV